MTQPNKDAILKSFLQEFPREDRPRVLVDVQIAKPTGEKVVELLKKEGLTYDEAYASLQYAYNLIKYESNFLKL